MAKEKYKNEFDRVHRFYHPFLFFTGLNHNKQIKHALNLKGTEHVLDIGAGTGLLAKDLLQDVASYDIIDKSEKMLSHHEESPKLQCLHGDFLETSFDKSYDVIILSDVLHHIKEQKKLLSKAYKLLSPNGVLFIHDFHKNSKRVRLLRRFEELFFDKTYFLTLKETEKLLREAHFTTHVQENKPFWFFLTGVKDAKNS